MFLFLLCVIPRRSLVVCSVVLGLLFFFSSRRRHTRLVSDWSSDVCSSDLRVLNRSLPGSTRSGENARKKSSPTLSPVDSSDGSISSRVVPGYVVDSSTTSWPDRKSVV